MLVYCACQTSRASFCSALPLTSTRRRKIVVQYILCSSYSLTSTTVKASASAARRQHQKPCSYRVLALNSISTRPPYHILGIDMKDRAVCTDGYSSGISYSCTKCSEALRRSTTWLAAVMLVVAVLVAIAGVADLVTVLDEDGEGQEDGARSGWRQRWSSCRLVMAKVIPLTAIKTVVVVWPIVTQVPLLTCSKHS